MTAKQKPKRPKEVFLSHSHHDAALTKRIAAELRRHGIKIWYSEHHIGGAQQWQDEIGSALERCDWFIVLMTPAAAQSKWVRREVSVAVDDDRYEGCIVPLVVKKCEPRRINWVLATIQYIEHKTLATTIRSLLRKWNVPYRKK